jgi:hypothetical protein
MGTSIRHFRELDVYKIAYEHILGKLVIMLSHPEQWTIRTVREGRANYA